MADVKVSVICSVYNNEKYIHQCVDSILSQSLQNIELILIDNGCTDNCTKIIDEYAIKDNRVVAVHNPKGSTYGKALNQGIAMARGDYIGIVESDDFVSSTMYEKLYDQITKFSADVALCSFTRLLPESKQANEIKLLEYAPKNRLFSIKDNPRMFYLHPCIWAKLYKKDILIKIKFDENERYLDQPFLASLFMTTNKLVCVPEYLYFYRQDNPQSSSATNRKDKSLIKIIYAYEKVKKILKKAKQYNVYKEHIYYHATYVIKGWLSRIDLSYRKEYLRTAYKYFKDLKHDKDFTFKFFSSEEKKFVDDILSRNWKAFKCDQYYVKRILGFRFYECEVKKNITKYNIIGLTIKRIEQCNDVIYKSYLCNIFRCEEYNMYYKYYILNIPVYQKFNFLKLSKEIKNITGITKATLQTELKRMIEVYTLHQKVFPQFKGIYKNKDIVICGAGPSLSLYEPLKDCIHIGVNKVFQNKKLLLDYSFLLDYVAGKNYIDELINYRGEKCKKFLGQLLEQNHFMFIPSKYEKNDDIYRYWVDESTFNLDENFNYDISTQTLPCFYSVIFQALSFALWTHPKKIYLVGCDANFAGHFDGSPMASTDKTWEHIHHIRNYDGWKKLKQFVSVYYPDIEIISVNPVGLKGMFHDMYTLEFLSKHSEVNRLNVEILK